jgi:hypothetical protein
MSRGNQVLTGILVLQIVVLLVVFWPQPTAAKGEPLFAGVEADQIVRLTVSDAGGQQVALAKGAEGWVLPDAGDYPVQEEKVTALLDTIVQMKADSLVTRTAGSHAQLGVADGSFQRLIEFELEGGTRHKLYLGTSPRYQVVHVRADDANEVYLALGLSTSDVGVTATSWVDPVYFSVPSDQITAITLQNGNGTFKFEKAEDGTWSMLDLPAGKTLNQNNVSSLQTRVGELRMQRPLGREDDPAYGLATPNAVVTLQVKDEDGVESAQVVRVGAQLGEGEGYAVKSANSPYYVSMADYTVSDLIEKTLDDFAQAPPTPEPPATATPAP